MPRTAELKFTIRSNVFAECVRLCSRYLLLTGLISFPAQWASCQTTSPTMQFPAAGAQTALQSGPYQLKLNSQIVVIDVVVNNQQGEPVRNLTGDDFTVYEDKVPQSIRSFEETSIPATASGSPIHSTAELDKLEPDAPVSVIVLDELTTNFSDEAFARYSLQRYLKSQGDTLSQPTMLIAANLDNSMVLRDYTTSRKELLDALDRHFAGYNWKAENGSWRAEQFAAAFSTLMGVAEATMGHRGHKNMIWIGRGFPSFRWEDLEANATHALQTLIATCTNLLRDARVTLYTVDPGGITVASPPTDQNGLLLESPFAGQVDFDTMATATGGQALHGRNDVDHLIGTSVRDGESFYTLSYRPANAAQDPRAFRNISIVMKDPRLHATTRQGYFAGADSVPALKDNSGKASARLVFDVGVALEGLMVYDGVPFTITRDPVNPDRFSLQVEASGLGWGNGNKSKQTAGLTLVIATFDKKGKQLSQMANHVTVGLPTLGEGSVEDRRIKLPITVATASPAARLRFVIRADSTGKVGADNVFLVDRNSLPDPATGLKPQHIQP